MRLIYLPYISPISPSSLRSAAPPVMKTLTMHIYDISLLML